MRARRLIVALAMAAASLATSASARTFYIIQSGPEAWTVMDPGGVEGAAGSPVRKAWAVRVQRNILSGNPPQPGYVRTLTEYDCAANRTRWREFSAYSRSGALLVSKVNPNPEWGPAEEAGDTQAAFNVICLGGGDGSVVSADSVAKVVIGLMSSWDPPPAMPAAPAGLLPTPKALPPAPAKAASSKAAPAKATAPKSTAAKPAAPKPTTAAKPKTT